MPPLPVVSGEAAIRAFERAGWNRARQKGSHVSLVKPGVNVNLSVPLDRGLDRGTLRKLIWAVTPALNCTCSLPAPWPTPAPPTSRVTSSLAANASFKFPISCCPAWVGATVVDSYLERRALALRRRHYA